jgi:hypothetical protein
VALLVVMAGNASAATLCLKESANGAVKGPETVGGSKCKAGYEKLELPSAEEMEILKHIKYTPEGIDKKPTIQFSGVNVQLVNGEGTTSSVNGEGNLVIGYDADVQKREQTGSHNLILGAEQSFTSFGGILGGYKNAITAPYASVTGGYGNSGSGELSTVGGGEENAASGDVASVGGGYKNEAEGTLSEVSGGQQNVSRGERSTVSGGEDNEAHGEWASVTGGSDNTANSKYSAITGGEGNIANGLRYVTIGGGYFNNIGANWSTLLGGKETESSVEFGAAL